jgi:hypothetical protein
LYDHTIARILERGISVDSKASSLGSLFDSDVSGETFSVHKGSLHGGSSVASSNGGGRRNCDSLDVDVLDMVVSELYEQQQQQQCFPPTSHQDEADRLAYIQLLKSQISHADDQDLMMQMLASPEPRGPYSNSSFGGVATHGQGGGADQFGDLRSMAPDESVELFEGEDWNIGGTPTP